MHIKFTGWGVGSGSFPVYDVPVEKVIPMHSIRIQKYNLTNYWVEDHQTDGHFKTYRVTLEEYDRLEKILVEYGEYQINQMNQMNHMEKIRDDNGRGILEDIQACTE